MRFEYLALFMDFAVLAGLAVAIYFAISISQRLNAFRNARHEMSGQINALNKSIENAENALKGLKVDSAQTSDELRMLVNDARLLADELQLINHSGNNLAQRLENLAEEKSQMMSAVSVQDSSDDWFDDKDLSDEGDNAGYDDDEFAIQDHEFENGLKRVSKIKKSGSKASSKSKSKKPSLKSKAEQDLYDALQGQSSKRNKA